MNLEKVYLRYAIYALCSSDSCTEEIKKYYNQYIDVVEISDQVFLWLVS